MYSSFPAFLRGIGPVFFVSWCLCGWHDSVAAEIVTTVAGNGRAAFTAGSGSTSNFSIGQPFGVEVGPDGKLYVTEVENHRVLRIDLAAKQVTTVAGSGRRGYAGDGGPATGAQLNEPYEVRFDRHGNMYFVEMQNHLIRRVDARSGVISTIAGTGKPGFAGDGGPAKAAMMSQPHSIALGGDRYLYVADIGNHRIRRIDLESGTIDSIAGNGEKKLPQDGQPVKDRPMLGPRALAFDRGKLWIALREGHSVWSLDLASGRIKHVAGTGRRGHSGDGGPAKQATFDGPKGIAVGPNGHVYVVDTENQAIRRIDPSANSGAGAIATIAGGGPNRRGYGGDNGPPLQAQFDRPHGIAVAPDNTIYIGDTNNHRVRSIK
jgi:streptogramin lyase